MKDLVIRHDGQQWHLWASVHPLDDPDATDRMTTEHATSPDGVTWQWRGTALAGRAGCWDARGVRFATVVLHGTCSWALYDGRATADENWRSGPVSLRATATAASPRSATLPCCRARMQLAGLRYADRVALPEGGARWFYEATRADGAHELRTVLLGD